jgi:serine/threonine protein phosphatase PrpC
MNSCMTLDEMCAQLVQAANKAGGHDNITCLIVRVD